MLKAISFGRLILNPFSIVRRILEPLLGLRLGSWKGASGKIAFLLGTVEDSLTEILTHRCPKLLL